MVLCEQPLAIAVIGVTGSGKSTFINLASNGSIPPTSTSPRGDATSLTSFSLDGRTVTLIDTPGFDDSTQNVLNVLKLISDSYSRLHSQGVKLAGVIYMHRVAEDRLGGPSRRNFHVFRKFCGDTSLRDVLIVANKGPTGWEPNDTKAREREFSPKDEFFRPALDKGARMLRHDGSQASAHTILRHLINREYTVPPVQGDSFDQRTKVTCTTMSADSVCELTGQVVSHAQEFEKLHKGLSVAALPEDAEVRGTLQENATNSLEMTKRIRVEKMVSDYATEKSLLEDQNCRYKEDFSAQKAEVELSTRLLIKERKARELAEAERGRAEAQLAKERASWERQKMESLRDHARSRYDRLLVCGTIVFALICVSRLVYDGSTLLQ